jgi:hypothetical protein
MQVAPNQISPGEPFDVFYFLRNPLDSATYYVRAKVYDVRTGELLSTIELEQSPTNARLFIKTAQAPGDPSGYGRNIVAIASVYLDSGFTQQSDNYEEQEQYYLIKSAAPVLGGGGGIDMRAMREMVEDVVAKKIEGMPNPEKPQEFPSEALFGAIGALQREVNRVPKEIDLSGISERLSALQAAISAIPEPEKPEQPDLSPIVDAVNSALFEIEQLKPFVQQVGAAVTAAQERMLREQGGALVQQVEAGLKELMGRQELTVPFSSLMKEKQPTPSPVDVSHLM